MFRHTSVTKLRYLFLRETHTQSFGHSVISSTGVFVSNYHEKVNSAISKFNNAPYIAQTPYSAERNELGVMYRDTGAPWLNAPCHKYNKKSYNDNYFSLCPIRALLVEVMKGLSNEWVYL